MRVCLILEGCYPYVRGGVSTWAQEYIKSNPDIDFVLWTVHSDRKHTTEPLYEIPENVTEIREIFLEDAYIRSKNKKHNEEKCKKIVNALFQILKEDSNDWVAILDECRNNTIESASLGYSESFFEYAVEMADKSNGSIGLSEAYYGLKSMLIPLYYLLQQDIPEADIYHSAVTGYGGILGALAKHKTNKAYILTEHGIYPREREEELLQADWVVPSLRNDWISLFYNLSKCAYALADRVTALFESASKKQMEIGCAPDKCVIIENGIHYNRFKDIEIRKNCDSINIGAFLRFAPIKDIKTLIYAFYELNQRISNVNLYILGGTDDEEYKKECKALIERLNLKNIFIDGYIDTVEYMKLMDLTVMTSISEGQPLAILESLAAARPCVTTNVGNCKGLLEDANDGFGKAGCCCAPMDSVQIATLLEELCVDDDKRIKYGLNGRKRIESNYTHEIMRQKYLKVYSEVM